ncbi:MAG: hypothetical protein IJA34_09340 [Lachnospiraceae bacterium]|nr:hypothetical protein [Lachnospiraceae bacterium]
MPFSSGCYTDELGNWYYYHHIDERTSLIKNGRKMSEDECFNNLKQDTLFNIQEKKRLISQYYRESMTNKKEVLMNLFLSDNKGVESVEEVVIEIEKIYEEMDDTDEGNISYAETKKLYLDAYEEETAIRLFKIYKYMDKFGNLIRNDSIKKEYCYILQRVNQIFGDMIIKAEKK